MKIIIQNSMCKVVDFSESYIDYLREKLSYESSSSTYLKIKQRNFYIDAKKYLLHKGTKKFPTGLLQYVLQLLSEKNKFPKLIDERVKPEKSLFVPLSCSLPDLRYYQQEALDVLDTFDRQPFNLGGGTFDLCTGSGKTLLSAHMIQKIGQPTVFIVPTLLLVKQTVEVFTQAFGKKLIGTHKGEIPKPITVGTIQSLVKRGQEYWDHFGMIMLDECHHSSSSNYKKLNKNMWNHIYYRFHLSGTPFRNDGTDLELKGVIGETLYSYKATQGIKDGFLVPPYFYIYQINNETPKLSLDFQEEYESYIVNNKLRNSQISHLVNSLKREKKQILILTERIEHGDILSEMIPGSTFIHGSCKENNKTIKKFDLGEISTLIATSGIMGEGIDVCNIDILVIAGGYKASSQVIQKIGRILRLRPGKDKAIVIDFYDKNTKFLEKHSKARIVEYRKYKTEVNIGELKIPFDK